MNFYKILNDPNGLRYKRGLNINTKPMDPEGTIIEEGGIRFARENIFSMLGFGPFVRQLTPIDYPIEDSDGIFRCNKVYLHKRRNLDVRRMRSLIAEGADIHASNDRAIFWACNEGRYEVVKALLDLGAVPAQKCLHYASATGHFRIVRTLLDWGLKPDETAIRWAEENKFERITRLLKKI